jgi:hypothetical protein
MIVTIYATIITGSRYASFFVIMAQTIRAILLASAIATSISGLRSNIRLSHKPAIPFRLAHWTTDMAPMISNRRISRCPIFDVRPSRSLPPLECCRGTRPSQAAKSRSRLPEIAARANAGSVMALSNPIPGMGINRCAT